MSPHRRTSSDSAPLLPRPVNDDDDKEEEEEEEETGDDDDDDDLILVRGRMESGFSFTTYSLLRCTRSKILPWTESEKRHDTKDRHPATMAKSSGTPEAKSPSTSSPPSPPDP